MKLEHLRESSAVCPVCGQTLTRGEIVAVTNFVYTFRRAHPACLKALQAKGRQKSNARPR
jgi:hypothetical protein